MIETTEVKNFTPHTVMVLYGDSCASFPSVGLCRAVSATERCWYEWSPDNGRIQQAPNWDASGSKLVPVMKPPEYFGVEWTPAEPEAGSTVIISFLAAEILAKTNPLGLRVLSLDTSPKSAVRDDAGQIIGVKRLLQWANGPILPDATVIQAVVPFNPGNPYDGWEVLGTWATGGPGTERAAIRHARQHADGMIDVPDDQPFFVSGLPEDEDEAVASIKEILERR